MTDISFSVPARLLASQDLQAAQEAPLDKGSLGRMVSKVMDAEPSQRWRYSIFTDAGSYLHAQEIEALANTRRYADWNAGHA